MLDEYKTICAQPRNPDDPPETEVSIVPLMLWSDSTHLADFGNASLWPVYLFFGFISKYVRCKPSSFCAHHLAYLPSDVYEKLYGTSATADVLRFCKRELMQAIWVLVLDPEFMHAYEHGLLLKCRDGILRRLFPRFFTYSADYPEKILLACIRYLARCPCPRCLIEKSDIPKMGTPADSARRSKSRTDTSAIQNAIKRTRAWVFEKGISLGSKKIAKILDVQSLVPTRSAFSMRLAKFSFNVYSLFVPDLLHEFELGVWKAVFVHLLRVLHAEGQDRIQKLNSRFRKVPTFGRDTIRRFDTNVSALKKLAARDYEDILQCVIPVFDHLLPDEHNELVLDMLFILATWQALAKLRLHTTDTIVALRKTTKVLGAVVRHFKTTTCEDYETYELPKEEAARGRRTAARKFKQGENMTNKHSSKGKKKDTGPASGSTRKKKEFNLVTYKWHSLGDYAAAIETYGPTDNYTMQTSKHSGQERTNSTIPGKSRSMNDVLPSYVIFIDVGAAALTFTTLDPLPASTHMEDHYHISERAPHSENIHCWLREQQSDPAVKNFLLNLKTHLLARLRMMAYDGDETEFSPEDLDTMRIVDNRIYFHKVVRINYTTYDMRRAQDSINPRSHADIMLLSHEDGIEAESHPYWYGRVVGIFHVMVKHSGIWSKSSEPQRIDVLWVRWFGREEGVSTASFDTLRLPRIGFVPDKDSHAFAFVNPDEVLRAAHLIPAFAHGRTMDLLPRSAVRQPREEDSDYVYYYVNM
ncbi:uncharacterized protein LAESUDRAFT_641648 [Laetiporus sulphureus 93-53]|uniref:Uncharacterized protein n=1 Tax=Laetiporus sulphureus 93-53 TaxID=1314785 RepID=A0A165HVN8_9APHY|nr:uncharacterized protein LAESUDRAFT_641648 [Laetiporus sulphureus 93-53]KZT12252.1 hypothetical protein LAESUDRAFT_641648 [Laetiporus sulphureus 93-53]